MTPPPKSSLGLPGTIHAPLDFLVLLTAAVKRGAPNTFVIGDMPFMSYQADEAEAMRNAGRFLTEGTADAVKLEADRTLAPLVSRMTGAGIPVIGHVGARPQWSKMSGGYRSDGRTADDARRIVGDAIELAEAGAIMILVEAVPGEVAEQIVEHVRVPVIGCGAGTACHGQIVVLQDLLGISTWQPSFARPIDDIGPRIENTASSWVSKVRDRDLGEHPYQMRAGEAEQFLAQTTFSPGNTSNTDR